MDENITLEKPDGKMQVIYNNYKFSKSSNNVCKDGSFYMIFSEPYDFNLYLFKFFVKAYLFRTVLLMFKSSVNI